jgi:hypothetical protein
VLAPKLQLGLSVRPSRRSPPASRPRAGPPPPRAAGWYPLHPRPHPAVAEPCPGRRVARPGRDLAALATITATRLGSSKARGPDLRVAIAKPPAPRRSARGISSQRAADVAFAATRRAFGTWAASRVRCKVVERRGFPRPVQARCHHRRARFAGGASECGSGRGGAELDRGSRL